MVNDNIVVMGAGSLVNAALKISKMKEDSIMIPTTQTTIYRARNEKWIDSSFKIEDVEERPTRFSELQRQKRFKEAKSLAKHRQTCQKNKVKRKKKQRR